MFHPEYIPGKKYGQSGIKIAYNYMLKQGVKM